MRFLVLGNPENRRVRFFQDACDSLGLTAPRILAWREFLDDSTLLDEALQSVDALRIESPGENFEVEEALIRMGGYSGELIDDPGRLRLQEEWYGGWRMALQRVDQAIQRAAGQIAIMNHPRAIALMFDKERCQRYLAAEGVPVPSMLGIAEDADEVFRLMKEMETTRVFVKPCHSSSASGVVALQRCGSRWRATTPVEMIEDGGETRLYNSLRLRNYTSEREIRRLLDALGGQRILVERWFPKAGHDGRTFDLRVLVIAERAHHVVARTSRSPITNLHLGNQRGDLEAIRSAMGEEAWKSAMATCERAGALFPNCHYVAVDLMVGPSFRSEAVAEVNAFGDLLPNLMFQGRSSYTAEVETFVTACTGN